MTERQSTIAALLLLIGASVSAWALQQRPTLEPRAASLAELPKRLGSFDGFDTPVGETVETMLRADFNVQRAYLHPMGQVVHLYVGYYGTERGGTPEHTPRACYAAHGWSIVEERSIASRAVPGLTAVEYLVESHGQQQLVLYWYRSFRATGLESTFALRVDHFLGRLLHGRADGALVRISTPLVGLDVEAARALLGSFATTLEPELTAVWPSEQSTAR